MEADGIVKRLDIVEDSEFCVGAFGKGSAGGAFGLQSAPEALDEGIVIAIALATHAAAQAGFCERLAVFQRGVLHPAVRMMDEF